jgi:hypothetical protein
MSFKRHIKILKCNLMFFGQAPLKYQVILKLPKAFTSKSCERCYNLNLYSLCDKNQPSQVEQVLVEFCDEAIGKENNYLKREVKRLEIEVHKLNKQTKVQPPQNNHSNIVKKLEK